MAGRKRGAQPGNTNGRGNRGKSRGYSASRLAERARKVEKRGYAQLRRGDVAGAKATIATSRSIMRLAKSKNAGVRMPNTVLGGQMSSSKWTNPSRPPRKSARFGG